tara:strand:- start:89 stop:664 length:576 start_codon:yes stop_codon:yes gene_type:complete
MRDFKEIFKVNLERSIVSVILAVVVFFHYEFWFKFSYYLTNKSTTYLINIQQAKQGATPIMAVNWWPLLLAILVSLAVGYLAAIILFNLIFRDGLKSFFIFSKIKLFITLSLLVFSFVLGMITIEAHQNYLRPIYYFFNPKFIISYIPQLFGNLIGDILIIPSWIFHMYFYSCLFIHVKDKIKKYKNDNLN